MKRAFIALAAAAVMVAPAFAQPSKTVLVPAELKTDAQVKAYTDDLLGAVDSVCRRLTTPMIGTAYDIYRNCKKVTAVQTAQKDPTGLLAARLGLTADMTVAAK
ncbi:MAG: hypothetical protein GC155_01430 [Alphaproteobacteria bacterium]|nr:hypothetical protein [Alphaproteobacteria bacterium]